MATNFNVSNAVNYTTADPNNVLQELILQGKGSKEYFTPQTGVKFVKILPYISNYDVTINNGYLSDTSTADGSTKVNDISLTSSVFNIFEFYTKESIDKKVVGLQEPGTEPSRIPIQDLIVDVKGESLFLKNEIMIWQGTSGSTQFDGINALVTEGGITADAEIDFITVSDSDILAHVSSFQDKLLTNFPELITTPSVLAMSPSQFQKYVGARYGLNGTVNTLTIDENGNPKDTIVIPGTMITAVSMVGLNGSNKLTLSTKENININYDLESEDEQINLLYNPFKFRNELSGQYKLGVTIIDVSKTITSAPSA